MMAVRNSSADPAWEVPLVQVLVLGFGIFVSVSLKPVPILLVGGQSLSSRAAWRLLCQLLVCHVCPCGLLATPCCATSARLSLPGSPLILLSDKLSAALTVLTLFARGNSRTRKGFQAANL